MNFDNPRKSRESDQGAESFRQRHDEVRMMLEAGDVKGALTKALSILYPNRQIRDLATEHVVDPWDDDWEGDNPMEQDMVNQAVAIFKRGDVEAAKKWQEHVLGDALSDARPAVIREDRFTSVPAYPKYQVDPALEGLSPEACQHVLVERWVLQNDAIPDAVKVWLAEQVRQSPVFADPTITRVNVTYPGTDPHGPAVTVTYETMSGAALFVFRQQ